MSNTIPSNKQVDSWQRIANELRKHRDAQIEQFGEVDDVTVARYLSGTATKEEKAKVRSEIRKHPRLKEAIKLVRTVIK